MTGAKELALETYPEEWWRDCDGDAWDANESRREGFIQGYEQAEKNLALTWEDVQLLDHFVLELVREEKEGKDWGDGKEFYIEVLARFKRFKEEKK